MMSPFGQERDAYYMQQAQIQAQKAYALDEVPIGAVVVNPQGAVTARAYNCTEGKDTQAAHAEVGALSKAGKKVGDWRLDGHWLYVTLEPCIMCMGLVYLSRLGGVVYAAPSPLFGYHLDNAGASPLYKKDAVTVIAGVGDEESARLLKKFFQEKRKKHD